MTDYQCARCGSSIEHVECDSCDEFGMDGHDCGEDCCCCEHPVDNVPCAVCGGKGGWWRCLSGWEWCMANPRAGRDDVRTGTVEEYGSGGAR